MIAFHRDHLVPPELCRLLYLTVPGELHVPVAFHNQPTSYVSPGCLATCWGDQIHINLNAIWWQLVVNGGVGSMGFRIWKRLLETCYHEFGHIASWGECEDRCPSYRGWQQTEALANDWMNVRMANLVAHDPRLAQPTIVKGYLGYKIARRMDSFPSRPGRALCDYVKEVRCRQTGGQLSSGDVLEALGVRPKRYATLRRVSRDLGVEYTDVAGRRHRLYQWGDLETIRVRLGGDQVARHSRAGPGGELPAVRAGLDTEIIQVQSAEQAEGGFGRCGMTHEHG